MKLSLPLKHCYYVLFPAFCLGSLQAYESEEKEDNKEAPTVTGHVFGWPFLKAEKMQPRGGTSRGGDVTLFKGEKDGWKKLQDDSLSTKERDRAAILAMQGSFRVSFDFMETAGFTADFKPSKPYFSWGTERVIALKEEENFISLQHVMVMYFKDKDGKETGPYVMKHWRQDWTYEDTSAHAFQGNKTWKKTDLKDTKGQWTQAVYQVDDSPRYEVVGKWEHLHGRSTWRSSDGWRPVPRREKSVRKDYNILSGRHEITITPNGWLHLQNNRKLNVLEDKTELIAHEIGINRYEEITAPDLKAGDASFQKTDPYWAEVRNVWDEVFQNHPSFSLKKSVDEKVLFMHHFEYAAKVEEKGWDEEAGTKHARDTIESFLIKE